MSHLIQLRKQIKSIQTTRKITHAVRLVSMSLYSKLEKQHAHLQRYVQSGKKLFTELAARTPEWKNSLLAPTDILDTTPLFIIVSTSKGLCGSLNSNLFRYFEQSLFIEEQQVPKFITIGHKATRAIKEKSLGDIVCSYSELSSHNYVSIADDLVNKITDGKISFSSVIFYSSFMKTFFIQKPHRTVLIPLSIEQEMSAFTKKTDDQGEVDQVSNNQGEHIDYESMIWEQDRLETLDYLSKRHMRGCIMHLLFQSLLAEQASRFLAMDSSTANADKFLEKLVLQFNKQRQSLITREVSELSAGAPQ